MDGSTSSTLRAGCTHAPKAGEAQRLQGEPAVHAPDMRANGSWVPRGVGVVCWGHPRIQLNEGSTCPNMSTLGQHSMLRARWDRLFPIDAKPQLCVGLGHLDNSTRTTAH
eukprot:3027871-Alexandrium_andersonii.AAC.1